MTQQEHNLIDENIPTEDNNGNAAFSAEEAFSGMSERLDTLESENKRLTDLIGKMVTVYGARLSESQSQGVEAFPTTLEPNTAPNTDTIPGLNDIVLGS